MFFLPPQVAGVQRPGLPGHGGRAGDRDVRLSRGLGFSVAVRRISPAAKNGVRSLFFVVVVPCSLQDFRSAVTKHVPNPNPSPISDSIELYYSKNEQCPHLDLMIRPVARWRSG